MKHFFCHIVGALAADLLSIFTVHVTATTICISYFLFAFTLDNNRVFIIFEA